MTPTDLIKKVEGLLDAAASLACLAHRGQRDKVGQPYILHPLRVMLAQTDTDALALLRSLEAREGTDG